MVEVFPISSGAQINFLSLNPKNSSHIEGVSKTSKRRRVCLTFFVRRLIMNLHLPSSFGGRSLSRMGSDPFSLLQQDLTRMVDDLVTGFSPKGGMAVASSMLRLDVKEDDKAFQIMADLPGMSEKDVDVTFKDGILTIRGEKKVERDEKKDTWHIVERSYGSFARQLSLPTTIDADKIEAKFEKGVLSVTLPKQPEEQAKAKKIEVKAF